MVDFLPPLYCRPASALLLVGAHVFGHTDGVLSFVSAQTPLLIVSNTALMDNHQLELANAMSELGCVWHTSDPTEITLLLRKNWRSECICACDIFVSPPRRVLVFCSFSLRRLAPPVSVPAAFT